MSKPKGKHEDGHVWTPVEDGRMRYEKGGPMSFSGEGRTQEELDAYRRNFDQIDWSDGRPNQARVIKARRKHPGLRDF